jgi:protein-L-isoaspartate O-methyltransferase
MQSYTRGKHTFVCKPISVGGRDLYHLSVRPSMTNEEYDDLKYRIESIGGHWREKFGGFVFDIDPMPNLRKEETWGPVEHSQHKKWKIMRQFYPTPDNLAEYMVKLAEIEPHHLILEPSAGSGALLRPLGRTNDIVAIEIDDSLATGLMEVGYSVVINSSFERAIEDGDVGQWFDRIVMNPPFSTPDEKQIGIKHIMLAYDLLVSGGILVAIIAENDLYYDTARTKNFNEFLKLVDAYVEEVPFRGFLSSGTSVDTVIIKIKKH